MLKPSLAQFRLQALLGFEACLAISGGGVANRGCLRLWGFRGVGGVGVSGVGFDAAGCRAHV